jgi:hypothetical protein
MTSAKCTSTGEYAASLLALIFNATSYTSMAINATSSPFTNLYVSLHTASPTATGTQTSNEAAYTSYARVAVARNSGGWTCTGNSVSPTSTIVFPTCTGGSETETYIGIGTSSSGAGHLLYFGAISGGGLAISNGVTPEIGTGSLVTET